MGSPSSIGRRRFFGIWLQRLLLGGAGMIFGGIFFDVWRAAARFSSDHWVEVASMTSLERTGVIPFPEHRLAVVRDRTGLGVLSLECTHLGCLVNTMEQGFYCPCHGSKFGPAGQVYTGPATRSLPWHPVRLRFGRIWVRTETMLAEPDWLQARLEEVKGKQAT